jgi:hypothetical protein
VLPLGLAAVAPAGWSHFQPSEFVVVPFLGPAPLFSAIWRNAGEAEAAP